MSGIEVLGLAFGALSLMINTAEHLDKVTKPIAFYVKFASKMERLQIKLNIQRASFRAQFQQILTRVNVIDLVEVERMLSDVASPLWGNEQLAASLDTFLGSYLTPWKSSVKMVSDKLVKLNEKIGVFGNETSKLEEKNNEGPTKEPKAKFKDRIKKSFSSAKLEQDIKDLRSLNRELKSLTEDVISLQTKDSHAAPTTALHANELNRFELIQDASRELYDALNEACLDHTEHRARLGLKSAEDVYKDGEVAFLIEFCAADSDTIMLNQIPPLSGQQVWITIRSTPKAFRRKSPHNHSPGTAITTPASSVLTKINNAINPPPCKRPKETDAQEQPIDGSKATKKRKVVRFATETIPKILADPSVESISVTKAVVSQTAGHNTLSLQTTTITAAQVKGDFCIQIRSHCASQNFLLGDPEVCTHKVCSISERKTSMKAVSLGQILDKTKDVPSRKGPALTPLSRIKLARVLAEALLQHHDSRWIPQKWKSSNIVFFTDRPELRRGFSSVCESTPHLETIVATASATTEVGCKSACYSAIRHPLLARLAIILLEIAYQAPLHSIDSEREENEYATQLRPNCEDPDVQDYLLAKEHLKNCEHTLGVKYKRLVEKCLGCDFGCGDDMKDVELQKKYYKNVIVGLQEIEEGLESRLRIS